MQAHLQHAAVLAVVASDTMTVRRIAHAAKQIRPGIRALLRTHSSDEAELLKTAGLGEVMYGERELAHGLARRVLQLVTPSPA